MSQAPMCYCPDPDGGYWAGVVFGVVMTLLAVAIFHAAGGRVIIQRIRSSWSQADAEG